MSSSDYIESMISAINAARSEEGQLELMELSPDDINYAYSYDFSLDISAEDIQEGSSTVENVTNILKTKLSTDGPERVAMMSKTANYFAVDVTEKDGNVEAVVKIFNKYVTVDEIGPFIDGNLVLQMTSHNPQELVPAVCQVEYAADSDESFQIISTIMPWQMIYNPSEDEQADSCAIPISLDPQYTEGSVNVTVFASPPDSVPHKEEVEGYTPQLSDMVPTVFIHTTTKNPESTQENDNPPLAYPAVVGLKVSCSPEGESELTQEGRQVCRLDLVKGFNESPDAGTWKFHIGFTTGSIEGGDEGVEDVMFLKKDKGGDFDIPDGFSVDSTNILAAEDNDEMNHEVNIAYKVGPQPRYSWVIPVSCEEADEKEAEAAFHRYVDQLGGAAEIRIAPAEINQYHGFRVALLLVYKENDIAEMVFSGDVQGSANQNETAKEEEEKEEEHRQEDDLSKITGDGFSSEEFSDDEEEDTFALDEQATISLQKTLDSLEEEKEKNLALNAELQKKCCVILARIGRDSQARGGNDPEVLDPANNNENNSEKEGHFADCVTAISDGRARLLRQQAEYDQLALDLQSRLDDKEFKAEEIMDSLNEFKREIMLKAENSRTGQGISKRLIKHYEQTERKKDAELEKVRLRNISLKTTLRRLEKTLRSREQLAEGLHMIDFEQLKIENQTLSEKIEERNEELAKLKRKKTVTVQILTHIREKLRYVTTQNAVLREELLQVDSDINRERSVLTSSKHERDNIREDNIELKRQRGFATSDLLIVDFEKRKSTIEQLNSSIDELRERYFLLTQQIERNTNKVKRSTGKNATALPPI